MAKRLVKTWPYDLPTATCRVCLGSGMNRRRAEDHVTSRSSVTTDSAVNAQTLGLKCSACEGRGRVLVAPAGVTS